MIGGQHVRMAQHALVKGHVVQIGVFQTKLPSQVRTQHQGVFTQGLPGQSGNASDGCQILVHVNFIAGSAVHADRDPVPAVIHGAADAVGVGVVPVGAREAQGQILILGQLHGGDAGSILSGILIGEQHAAGLHIVHVHGGAGLGGQTRCSPLGMAAVNGAIPEGQGVAVGGQVNALQILKAHVFRSVVLAKGVVNVQSGGPVGTRYRGRRAGNLSAVAVAGPVGGSAVIKVRLQNDLLSHEGRILQQDFAGAVFGDVEIAVLHTGVGAGADA